jgi:hypothetical protein
LSLILSEMVTDSCKNSLRHARKLCKYLAYPLDELS